MRMEAHKAAKRAAAYLRKRLGEHTGLRVDDFEYREPNRNVWGLVSVLLPTYAHVTLSWRTPTGKRVYREVRVGPLGGVKPVKSH